MQKSKRVFIGAVFALVCAPAFSCTLGDDGSCYGVTVYNGTNYGIKDINLKFNEQTVPYDDVDAQGESEYQYFSAQTDGNAPSDIDMLSFKTHDGNKMKCNVAGGVPDFSSYDTSSTLTFSVEYDTAAGGKELIVYAADKKGKTEVKTVHCADS